MDLALVFVPFIFAAYLAAANDPLTRRFMDDWNEGR